jgi:hypothetical protein
MTLINKWLARSSTERYLLLQAFMLVVAIRVGLWTMPFAKIRCWLERLVARAVWHNRRRRPELAQVVRAVVLTSAFVPRATCLTQALAAHTLLRTYDYASEVRIGVARAQSGSLQAHAWVEVQGLVVIGGADAPMRFTTLPLAKGKRRESS